MVLLPGDLTHNLAAPAMLALQEAIAGEPDGTVVVDASSLINFDSSALAVLLACRREVLARGKAFAVKNLHGRLRQLAGMYGIEPLLPANA
ncbi:MAG TPA: STAS domain-containing protein [Polaromonas sp.]|uniref:STAS domain-containing protein n=1 Tax=Polaromonas sp. TaxID=1869339 RepID=UPI002D3C9DE7|nr:STAS domain-containing protein [Polaromonas sp.]HYW56312.1 STAS domain-containing protein [Polaromonas sp.]